jgi:threonine synthase
MARATPLHYVHECIACGSRYDPDRFYYVCQKCGGLLLVQRDEDSVTKSVGRGAKAQSFFDNLRFGRTRQSYPNDSGVWLWRQFLLPGFPEDSIVSLKEGQTDMFETPEWLLREIGIKRLFVKLEGQSPSESFKDRGMPVAVSDALRLQREYPELGITGISCASTGDTSAAAAIYAAYVRDRLSCLVLVPHSKIADAQLFQAMAYGADVRAISHADGFDGCMRLIQEFTAAHPERVLVNSKNDMRIVGQESIALEIMQDLRWQVPDWIAIPVGNGGNLTAMLVSLKRAYDFGLIDRLPGIIAGQTAAADTLVRWQDSDYKTYAPGHFQETVASAMNINDPVSFPRIHKLYSEFDIHFYRSQESEILDAWAQFMRSGANICPQGAVAIHATRQARDSGLIGAHDTVVAISTASSLKFTESGIRYHKGSGEYANHYQVVGGTINDIEASLVPSSTMLDHIPNHM